MQTVLQHVVDTIASGAVYALIALGLGVMFGIMRLINFAYGELIMVGGFAMVLLRDMPWPLLVLGTLLAVVIVSLLTERLAFRPLRGADPTTLLLASFAVSVILQNVARMSVGATSKGVEPYEALGNTLAILGVRIGVLDLLAIALTVALLVSFYTLMTRTRLGVEIRAAAADAEMAKVLGIKSNRVIGAAFAISGVLAGIGTLVLIFQQGAVSPTVGTTPVLIAFVAIVVGGMGSLTGAGIGGFVMGALGAILSAALPTELAPFRDAFLFTAVLLMLSFRPQGLIPAPAERI